MRTWLVGRAHLCGIVWVVAGCASVSMPVLRHETGEALGSGKVRVSASIGTSRVLPTAAASFAGVGFPQSASLFRGNQIGAKATVGVTPSLDFQLRTVFSPGGGGWSIGVKQQFFVSGPFALSAMIGIGRYSGGGTINYETVTGSQSLSTVLTANQYDVGVPVSYRFGKDTALYSGLHYYRSSFHGSAGTAIVEDSASDLGVNLGIRQTFGRVDVDLEAMMLKMGGPFTDRVGFTPFLGLAAGLAF